jgi:hypothetical protein
LRLVILMKTGAVVIPVKTGQVVIPVKTGIQGRALDPGVRRGDD